MSKLKLKINVNLLQLLSIVVSVALHGEFAPIWWVITVNANPLNRSNSPCRSSHRNDNAQQPK